jgi:hypothetical protein
MRTDCIVKLSKLQISELNTLVQKETSGDVEGNLLLRTLCPRPLAPEQELCFIAQHIPGPTARNLDRVFSNGGNQPYETAHTANT